MTTERDDFKQFTDEQLVFLIQRLNQDPFEILLGRYTPLIVKVARSIRVYGFDYEDLFQESRIVFHRVVQCYDAKKGISLGTFFRLSLENHLHSLVRRGKADKRKNQEQSASLEEMAEKGLTHSVEYRVAEKNLPLEYTVINDSMKGFTDTLSKFENKVFSEHMKDRTLEEIAVVLGVTESRVRNALSRSKKKMVKYLAE